MRILQVVHGFPPHEWTGTELVTLQLAQALRVRGHDVSVLTRVYDTQRAEGSIHETTYEDLPVFQLINNYTVNVTFPLSYNSPVFNRPFLQMLEQLRPEVVHVQHTQHLSVSMLRLAAALGYPTVLSLHDFFFACHRIQLINAQQQLCAGPEHGNRCVACLQDHASAPEARRRFLDMQRTLHAPDVVLTPSRFLARKMETYFPFLKDTLRVVPLGVDPLPEAERQRPSRPAETPLRVLYVGVLAPHKGAHLLLEALKGLPTEKIVVSLYGVEWPQWQAYSARLRETAKELPVKFCGTYPHDQLGSILMEHDVLVMPAIWEETFSILTREALLAGVPVVAARRGALVDVVQHGVNGLLFEPEDAASLRDALQRLVTEPTLLEELRRVEPHVRTMVDYAQEIESVYHDVCQTRELKKKKAIHNVMQPSTEGASRPPVKVSVCIPTYNGSAFLAEAIRSVLTQTCDDFELLVVDDRSTDETLAIARSFTDPRIRVHQNEARLGIPENWNRCIDLAQGEYICLFHQDDRMLPDNLARKVAMLDADSTISFVHSAVELLIEESAPNILTDWMEEAAEDCVIDGKVYFRKLLFGNRICAPAVMTRRSQFATVGQFAPRLGFACDYVMWLKMCVEGKVGFLSQPLLLYRWHERNASHAFRFERGADEVLTARREALRHYAERNGKQEELQTFHYAIEALSEVQQHTVALDHQSERHLAYARELEQVRDRLVADVEKVGKSWEEQARYIQELEQLRDTLWAEVQRVGKGWEEQTRYIHELEQLRDTLWAEVQRVGNGWKDQARYIGELEHQRNMLAERLAMRWSERAIDLARRLWARTRSN